MSTTTIDAKEIARAYGCGDHGCAFGYHGGMATQGGCQCLDKHNLPPDVRQRLRGGVLALRQALAAAEQRADAMERRHRVYFDAIGKSIGPRKTRPLTGEPAQSDAKEVAEMRHWRDRYRALVKRVAKEADAVEEFEHTLECEEFPDDGRDLGQDRLNVHRALEAAVLACREAVKEKP